MTLKLVAVFAEGILEAFTTNSIPQYKSHSWCCLYKKKIAESWYGDSIKDWLLVIQCIAYGTGRGSLDQDDANISFKVVFLLNLPPFFQ